ncbi:hypothetical protein [Cryptosporangium japonicum]|uniref:Uncharacterized protein n=1 Tax=Cryptosporangium japonicum TaxID=80872 RepID=A0ABN0UES4_9ACTN
MFWGESCAVPLIVTALLCVTAPPVAHAAQRGCPAPDWRTRPGSAVYAYTAEDVWIAPTTNGRTIGLDGTPLAGKITPGDVVRITATGRVSYGGWFNWRGTWGPAGNGRRVDPRAAGDWPFRGGRDAALVGKWRGTGTALDVGVDSGCVTVPPGAGQGLLLVPNDDQRWDNGDVGYTATIEVSHWEKVR